MGTSPPSIARMDVPTPFSPLLCGCYYLLLLTLTVLAISNLVRIGWMPCYAIVASTVWLTLMALLLYGAIDNDGGVLLFLINRLGVFSRSHFVEADFTGGHPEAVRFGYKLCDHRFYYRRIECQSVSSVEWCAGQATAMAGQDMNDWHVIVWYHHPRPRFSILGHRGEELHVVGMSGPKDAIERLGLEFVAFLQSAGVPLRATDNPTEFTMTGTSMRVQG